VSDDLELISAVKEGDGERARELCDAGADVHQRDEHGWTPLNWAVGQGDAELVRLLLDRGADVTETGRDNRTPLMIAKAAGHQEVAGILAEAERAKGVWEDPRETRPYCKAYYLDALRRFDAWNEGDAATPEQDDEEDSGPLTDESIVYVHQDFTVTRSMWHGEDVVFDEVTPDWRVFCERELEFEIPDDLL
jgi:hypothetical protein